MKSCKECKYFIEDETNKAFGWCAEKSRTIVNAAFPNGTKPSAGINNYCSKHKAKAETP